MPSAVTLATAVWAALVSATSMDTPAPFSILPRYCWLNRAPPALFGMLRCVGERLAPRGVLYHLNAARPHHNHVTGCAASYRAVCAVCAGSGLGSRGPFYHARP